MRAIIEIMEPVYGEWVDRAGTQDRPFKGLQPLSVEVNIIVSPVAGVGYIREDLYHFKHVTDPNLSTVESIYKRTNWPKWELSNFNLI